jgi:hypothetical protein
MKTLLDEKFAPITSKIGYLRLDLDAAALALEEWLRDITPDGITVERMETGFPACLRSLEPLTMPTIPRHLLVEASNGWTAYFNCSLRGTDAVSAIGHLSQQAGCHGLIIVTVPHKNGSTNRTSGRLGAVQFQMLGPVRTDFLNYVRTIDVGFDGKRWEFELGGTPQEFEELDAYKAFRIRDRFTSTMLERYCAALGVEVFDPDFYGARACLVHRHISVPEDAYVMSLDVVQQWLGIIPGEAANLPG